jgi:hypothetical protein
VIRESLLDMGAPVPVQPRHSVASASSP